MIKKSTQYPDADLMVIMASREEIEEHDTDRILEVLNSLLETQNVRKNFSKVEFCVSGYDFDARELCEIPEVKHWLKEVDRQWNYWFWFLNPYSLSLKFITFTLCQYSKVSPKELYLKPEDLRNFMFEHFHAMNIMFNKGLITEKENYLVSKKIEQYFSQM